MLTNMQCLFLSFRSISIKAHVTSLYLIYSPLTHCLFRTLFTTGQGDTCCGALREGSQTWWNLIGCFLKSLACSWMNPNFTDSQTCSRLHFIHSISSVFSTFLNCYDLGKWTPPASYLHLNYLYAIVLMNSVVFISKSRIVIAPFCFT